MNLNDSCNNIKEIIKTKRFYLALQALYSRNKQYFSLLVCFVYFPTILLFLYLTLFFSSMYISESSFALRSSESNDLSSVVGMFFQNSTSTTLDAHIIQNHITSMDMLEKVDSQLDLKKHFCDSSKDIYSRLTKNSTKEEFLTYWQWLVTASFNTDKGIITVEVKAYTPEFAQQINQTILSFSEELVNQINSRAHTDALRLTQKEVTLAETRILQAQLNLKKFRDTKSILNPQATAQGLEEVITGLEAEAAATQAELTSALSVMQANSPRVQSFTTKLHGLQDQIIKERTRLAGIASNNSPLSALVGDYTQLVTEEEFAQKQLVQSMAAHEGARLKALSQSRYIVPFQPPTLPEESLYPRPFLFTALGFLILLIVVGLCSLIFAAIKDHMGV